MCVQGGAGGVQGGAGAQKMAMFVQMNKVLMMHVQCWVKNSWQQPLTCVLWLMVEINRP